MDVETSGSSGSGFLLDALRRRPAGRRALTALTVALFVAGIGLFAYPFFTDVYTDQVLQSRLEDDFAAVEVDSFQTWEAQVKGSTGAVLTRIAIPDLGVETLVVEGTTPAALRAGAGHYPTTPLPGQPGNVAIAGHRTTYGKPFNRIDELAEGSDIWLATPVGDYLYRVGPPPSGWGANPFVTDPRDWSVIAPTGAATLTLTTCNPKGSAAQRLVVRAALVEEHPAGTYAELSAQASS